MTLYFSYGYYVYRQILAYGPIETKYGVDVNMNYAHYLAHYLLELLPNLSSNSFGLVTKHIFESSWQFFGELFFQFFI